MAAGDDSDHPVAELLAAPVRAIQEAQIAAEREFVEFFLEYGLEPYERRERTGRSIGYRVRNVEFEMRRAVADPMSPGQVVERTATVSAPLISLLNLPSVSIEEATINLSLDVSAEQVESDRPPLRARVAATGETAAALLPEIRRPTVQLRGAVGNRTLSRSFRSKGRLEVTIKLVSSRDQDGLGRLTALLNEGLSSQLSERG
jgi:Protein of unknown function (DUF2589)